MRPFHCALFVGASLLLALSSAANAHSSGGAPAGFSSGGQHGGFETFSNTSTSTNGGVTTTTTNSTNLPGGWDQGNAAWKEPLQTSNPMLTTLPPGLSK